jgi:hypothetical protein
MPPEACFHLLVQCFHFLRQPLGLPIQYGWEIKAKYVSTV